MDLYTLTPNFLGNEDIDEYVSAIWTERYSKAGDTQIVTAATEESIATLAEGTLLGLRGSKEIMILDTQTIKDGILTVVGQDLLSFLNERQAWFYNPVTSDADSRVADLTLDTMKPGEFIAHIVDMMVINPTDFPSAYVDANLVWADDVIPNLSLGPVDASGVAERLTATIGPLYDSIQQVAEKEGVGISLYLESADPDTGYSLKFSTYRGVDRTSDQTDNPLIRLSPDLDSISDVSEVRSIKDWKNVAYVYYQGEISVHLEDQARQHRRVLTVASSSRMPRANRLVERSHSERPAIPRPLLVLARLPHSESRTLKMHWPITTTSGPSMVRLPRAMSTNMGWITA
jgi:hypothetical protein